MTRAILGAVAVACLVLATSAADAKQRRHHRASACDGIHRCKCGSTQAAYFGLPRTYKGHNLWQAIGWKRAFPRTSAAPGMVGYQRGGGPTGHVFRIVSITGACRATVIDDRGQYERNICGRGAVFVNPRGAWASAQ